MTTQQYITNLGQRYQLGNATEHTFRGDLQQLIENAKIPSFRDRKSGQDPLYCGPVNCERYGR